MLLILEEKQTILLLAMVWIITCHGLGADLAPERKRADKAIAAFEQLARRLEEMAEARRPWWRRLASPAWGKRGT